MNIWSLCKVTMAFLFATYLNELRKKGCVNLWLKVYLVGKGLKGSKKE